MFYEKSYVTFTNVFVTSLDLDSNGINVLENEPMFSQSKKLIRDQMKSISSEINMMQELLKADVTLTTCAQNRSI